MHHRIVELLQEIDVSADPSVRADAELEAFAVALRKRARHVSVGDEHVCCDEPAGPNPGKSAAQKVDTAYCTDRGIERLAGALEALLPGFAIARMVEF
jgi:hypothetical protein